ncbi:hypothetical protein CKF54_04085 [Psittacicella hinzii]|uniref:Surface protein n=1 Tax=Psittacicella hinzii TaxID=2028575 RepID=A0A3A1Y6H5_9GAMM|nr:BspA family leucine-rich repeat surface protein [Psittacicella hinzii]RIY32879.1 hypothetical protein CKF54_04085 [Psittacicella hinzii]
MTTKTIATTIAISLALSVGGLYAYDNISNVYTDVTYDSSLGELYGKNLAYEGKKFVFTNSKSLKKFIDSYVKYHDNEKARLDLNFIDISKLTDLNYVFSGENNYISKEEYELLPSNEQYKYTYYKGLGYFNCNNTVDKIHKISISTWKLSKIEKLNGTFACGNFDIDVSQWDVSGVKEMKGTFLGNEMAPYEITYWDVGNVTNMSFMFAGTLATYANLRDWNVSKLEHSDFMFAGQIGFSVYLNNWNLISIKSVTGMLRNTMADEKYFYKLKDKISPKLYEELLEDRFYFLIN